MKEKIKIDIVSDVVCPWCTIGYKHLEKAIAELGIEDQVEIEWQPFELNPYMPEDGQDLEEHIAEKYGATSQQQEASKQNMIAVGAKVDFTFDYFEGMRMVNTFDAHVLLEYARKFDKQTALKMRLTTAFFSERKDVSQLDILEKALLDVGLNAEEALTELTDEKAREAVKTKKEYWQKMGVTSVPTIVFNKTDGVTGAQPIEVFKNILNEYI